MVVKCALIVEYVLNYNTMVQMQTSKKKILLLILTIYSFFICFIMNVFGYALSYSQLTYEWNIPNIYEGRKEVFKTALIHFFIFAICVSLHLKKRATKKNAFKPVRTSDSVLQQEPDEAI